MTDYNIRVRIDPSDSTSGSRAVRTSLEGIEQQAKKTSAAVKEASTIDASGAASGAGVVQNNLDKISDAAQRTGVSVQRALDFSNVRPNFAPALGSLDGLAAKAGVAGAAVNNIQWTGSARFIGQFGAADNAVERLEAEIAKLQSRLNTLSRTPSPTERMAPSLRQTQQATLQAGQQFQDFAQQVTLGINPITAFTQQAGQMAFAMSNMEGKVGAVGRFLGGPWGTLVLVATSVLGQFAYQMLQAGDATEDARDALEQYAKKQSEVANFVDLTTGKIIQQTAALQDAAIARARLDLADSAAAANQASREALSIARTASYGGRLNQILSDINRATGGADLPADKKISSAIDKSYGDVPTLVKNLRALGPEYSALADKVSAANAPALAYADTAKKLNAALEAYKGNVNQVLAQDAQYQANLVKIANATSERERALIRLSNAQTSYNAISKATGADSPQAKAKLAELDAAYKAVNQAKEEEKVARDSAAAARRAASAAEREGDRYAELIRRLKAEGDLVDLYGKEYEIRKAQISVENSLRRALTTNGDGGGEAGQVRRIVETNLARKAEADVLRQIRQPIEDYKTQIEALDTLLGQGKITQEQYNAQVQRLPFRSAINNIDETLLGAADRYDAQIQRLKATISDAIATIQAARDAGAISKEEADRRIGALRTQTKDENGDPTVTGEPKNSSTALGRGISAIDLARREDQNRIDQTVGGEFGKNAEREAIQLDYERRLEDLKAFYGASFKESEEYAKREASLRRRRDNEQRQFDLSRRAVAIQAASSMFDTLTNLAEEFGGRQSGIFKALFAVQKAFAIAEAIINIQRGLSNALAAPTLPEKIAAYAYVVSQAATIISSIRSVSLAFRDGGYVSGPGGPRDDKINARLSAGEFVVNAPATARNRPILEAMNSGRDYSGPATTKVSGGGGVVLQVGDINVTVESSGDPQQDGQIVGRAVKDAIKGAVREELISQSRSGGLLTRQRQSSLTS